MKHTDSDASVSDDVESWVDVPNETNDIDSEERETLSREDVAPPEDHQVTFEDNPLVSHLTEMGFEKESIQKAIGGLRKGGVTRIDADSVIGWMMGEGEDSASSRDRSGDGALSKNGTDPEIGNLAVLENGGNDVHAETVAGKDNDGVDVYGQPSSEDSSESKCEARDQIDNDAASTKGMETDAGEKATSIDANNGNGMDDTSADQPSENPSKTETPIVNEITATETSKTELASKEPERPSDDIIKDSAERSVDPSLHNHSAAYLTSTYESLESMRKLNLEVEFADAGGPLPVCHAKCTHCQREALQEFLSNPPPEPPVREKQQPAGISIGSVTLDGSRLRRLKNSLGMEEVKLDGSRLRQFKSSVEEVAMDGRRFGSSMGSFFSKSAAVVTNGLVDADARKNDSKSEVSKETTSNLLDNQVATPNDKSSDNGRTESIRKTKSIRGSMTENDNSASRRRNLLEKIPHPCLTCGHPTCTKHASPTFLKNRISICQNCARLFELDHLMDSIASTASNPDECQRRVDRMVDRYDRAKFLLVYTAQYADKIAASLESQTVRSNRINAGSSATGVVSGLTGVAGCGALLFPPIAVAGVPLLIASLALGGSATVAQSGDAAAKYFGEPNRMAEQMVALHGMVLSLLRITEVLSHGLLKSHLGVNYSVEGRSPEEGEGAENCQETLQHKALAREINELLEKHGVSRTTAAVGGLQSAVTSGIVATEVAATVGTRAAVGGMRLGRVGTTAAASARFIPIAGGLLSAACVVAEGRELKKTLERIDEGDPCVKAVQVRSIRDELHLLPDSSLISTECRRVFELAEKEKLKRAELVDAKHGLEDGGRYILSSKDVSQGDISDLIDVMETAAKVEAMQ